MDELMLKKIKFRTKFFLLLVLTIVCSVAVVVVGIVYNRRIESAIVDINLTVVIPMEKLNSMSASLKTIESAMRDSSINRYSGMYKVEKDFGFVALSGYLLEFEELTDISEAQTHIDTINISLVDFNNVCDSILSATQRENFAEARELLNGAYRAYRDIIGHSITSLSTLTKEQADIKQKHAEGLTIQAIQISIFLIIATTVILLPLLYYAMRSVMRPLKSMTAVAESISNGDFSQRIPNIEVNDEFGMLADSFNSMMQCLATRDCLLNATSRIAQELLLSGKGSFDDSINNVLSILGEATGVDRVYIWNIHSSPHPELNPELHTTQLYEWSLGAEPQQDLDICTNRPVSEAIPTWINTFISGQCVNNLVKNMPILEQEQLSPQGIISIMTAPISFYGELWGFIGFDDCHSEHIWSEAEENILRAAGIIVGSAIYNHRINQALNEVSSANKAKSEFLANMSHEIRTPLNAIIGMSELAAREAVLPTVKGYAQTIMQAGTNLLDIINDILDFSKIESGNLEIIQDNYMLSSLINDVVHVIKTKTHEKRLRFIINIDNNIPNALFGDIKKIRQIMLNLLSNAVKYTEKGFVSLVINGVLTDNDSVILTIKVADSGMGISQANINNLFDKFTRFDIDKNINIEGTGLGLAITKALLDSMGGTVDVKSILGEGSVFTVEINQKVRNYQKLAVIEKVDEINVLVYERREICINSIIHTMNGLNVNFKIVSSASEFYREMRHEKYTHVFVASVLYERVKTEYPDIKTKAKIILIAEYGEIITEQNISILTTPIFSIPVANFINGVSNYSVDNILNKETVRYTAPDIKILSVDDVKTNLFVLEGLLNPYKMQIVSCKSGKEAIEALKAVPYDLVFMDHMMPEMDGIETTKRIKELINEYPYLEKIPIVALSANAVLGAREMFLENNFDDYLSKPIDTVMLHNVLTKWIPQHKWVETKKNIDIDIAEKESDTETEININGLNIQKSFAVKGNVKNYLNTLAVFYKDGTEKIKEIKSCLDSKNLHLYTIYVHALKSASANIGAEDLSEAARILEEAGKKGDVEFINIHTKQLIFDLEALLGEIDTFLKKSNINKPPASIDMGLLKNELSKLKDSIQKYDSAAIKESTDILHKYAVTNTDLGKTIEDILKSILNGDDDGAIYLIDSVR